MVRRRATWKEMWSEFRAGTPGSRFSDQHRRRGQKHGARVRLAFMMAGAILVATGALLFFTPGPGFVLVAIGAAVLARESARAARLFDRLEVQLRGLVRAFPRRRGRSPRVRFPSLLLRPPRRATRPATLSSKGRR